jgi:hypothetical protein
VSGRRPAVEQAGAGEDPDAVADPDDGRAECRLMPQPGPEPAVVAAMHRGDDDVVGAAWMVAIEGLEGPVDRDSHCRVQLDGA